MPVPKNLALFPNRRYCLFVVPRCLQIRNQQIPTTRGLPIVAPPLAFKNYARRSRWGRILARKLFLNNVKKMEHIEDIFDEHQENMMMRFWSTRSRTSTKTHLLSLLEVTKTTSQ
ncbi:Hypothetical predicted protein [Olea europaea subsp. europaea]|uniref:Uncharacterized protein n=1 Tax=Olea europaea subsp. europaea TaxID=158383 RepID=A0A8S0VPV1_OLEEU|nr:Hypothetical predicted protein [Olea europaea subsp. europaea]